MKKFVIMADATCDLGEELQTKYDIKVIPGHLILPNGEDIPSFLKWERYTREGFYAELKKAPDAFKTSPANVQEFASAFEAAVEDGADVLAMTISSGISGAYNFALTARDQVLEKYPDAVIKVIDTMRFGPGFGLMAIHAAEMREAGKSADEIAAYLEANKNRYHQAGWLDDLSFVAKKGRITHSKAFFGTMVGVKPLGEFDYNGLTTVIGKTKGAKKAYDALLKYMEATGEDLANQMIFIAQTDRLKQAEEFKALIEEKFHPKAVYIKDVFPACGVNIGPGLMAAYYVGKPISKDLSEEMALMNGFING